MNYYTLYNCSIGNLILKSDGEYLISIDIQSSKNFISNNENYVLKDNLPIFYNTKNWIHNYFLGLKPNPKDLKLKLVGSEFSKQIWQILLNIPYGETMSYKQIAQIIAKEKGLNNMSYRAVGNAVGHNPIPIIVPCHRVISHNGKIGGYAYGIKIKKFLLTLENIQYKD